MTIGFISFLLMQSLSLMLDAAVRPRDRNRGGMLRSAPGLILHCLTMTALFGLILALSGSAAVAGGLVVALMAVFVTASNAKHAMLGEPLLFSDLALLSALVSHPGFYFTALSIQQKSGLAIGALGLLLALVWLFVPHLAPHLVGAGVLLLAGGTLAMLLRGKAFAGLARTPDIDADLARHGLIATLLLYWRRWHETPDPPLCPPGPAGQSPSAADFAQPDLVIVIQCESFADPVDLTQDPRHALPGLARARAAAAQWGNLGVSGFGAYTMRTEFGVLFGRSEAALGFRRYDPFLTARREGSYALSARLGASGYRCLFVHPHDLRFYGRDQMMPAIGFDRLIGEEHFPPVVPGTGRYVSDRTLGATLRTLIDEATDDPAAPTFLYAVTMENHGPWMKDRVTGSPGGLDAYLHHVRNSDTMLTELIDGLADTGRSALLVFFGDHRPSIPGVAEPGPVRHTPYVMLRFVDGKPVPASVPGADGRIDLTPDQLHHAILRAVRGASVTSA